MEQANAWPDLHRIESFNDQLFPIPDNDLLSADGRNDWMTGTLAHNFPTLPSLNGLGMGDGDAFPEFLTNLPNEDDWSRWHSGPEISQDLDGMQFGRYT